MIKIRYRDPNELSPGLHAAAERRGRSIVVYLLPGLSTAERRAALRRLRISARMGRGPRLPRGQLAVARLTDRVRITLGQAGAVFRSHPAGSTVPVMVVSAGAIAFLALSAVSIRVIHPSHGAGQSALPAGVPAAPANAVPGGAAPAGPAAAGPGRAGSDRGQLTAARFGSRGSPGSRSAGDGVGSDRGGTTLAGRVEPTPSAGGDGPSPAPAVSQTGSASPTAPAPSPTPSPSRSRVCVVLGSVGFCV